MSPSRPKLPLFLSLSLFLLLVSLTVISHLPTTSAQSPFTQELGTCATTERFDVSSLNCFDCTGVSGNALASADGLDCACASGYERDETADNDQDVFTCDACPAGEASLRDSSGCVPCDGGTGATLAASGDCECPTQDGPGFVLVEEDAAGVALASTQCLACPSHARVFPSVDPYTCVECPHEAQTMASDGSCTCQGAFSAAGSTCVESSFLAAVGEIARTVQFNDLRTSDSGSEVSRPAFSSQPFEDLYVWAAANCEQRHDREACQALGNMCVLERYSPVRVPCVKFNNLAASAAFSGTTSNGFLGWVEALPWLEFPSTSVLTSDALGTRVSLGSTTPDSTHTSVSTLEFVLYKYAFNGTFLGTEELTTQLHLCSGDPAELDNFLRFGSAFEKQCELRLRTLLDRDDPVFYDMYIIDLDRTMYPVPVKVLNYRDLSGTKVNADGSSVLHRRFFLYDTLSSRRDATADPSVVVWAKEIKLSVKLRSGSESLIYPPLLTILYGEREVSRLSSTGTDSSSVSQILFEAQYTKDLDGLWLAATVLVSIFAIFIGFVWIKKIYVWQKTNAGGQADCSTILQLMSFGFGTLADFFFWLTVALTFYCFIFYKGQETAFFLLPARNGAEVDALYTFVTLCFFGKLGDLIYLVWRQIHIDIFFIDWERPRGVGNVPVGANSGSGRRSGGGAGLVPRSGHRGAVRDPPDFHDDARRDVSKPMAPVSVWRRLFVANKWNTLQTSRQVNIEVTLFLLLIFLRGIRLEYWATAQPAMSNRDPDAAPIHPLLRFAVTTFFWLLIAGMQVAFRQLIYHRYFKDDAADFVDLLSITNISCIILDQRFHGYYIHGKSVHAHADTSLLEMNKQLAQEVKSWTKQRGLVDGKDAFEIYYSRKFRARYDALFGTILSSELQNERLKRRLARAGAGGSDPESAIPSGRIKSGILNSERLIVASEALNSFLQQFINKNLPHEYPWDEGRRTFFEKRFNLPPNLLLGSDVTMFFDDPSYNFTQTVLMGIEWDIVIFEILFYALCDIVFDNTFVSVILTYILDHALAMVRSHWGKANVSNKTLIDERFLI